MSKLPDRPANFTDSAGKVYLVYCPNCGLENYGPSVATGICAWCGFDGNEKAKEAE
jgi:ribosomal protein L37E